jgi:hypothetical protein
MTLILQEKNQATRKYHRARITCRWNTAEGKRYSFATFWRHNDGKEQWRLKHLPAPRPLLNLHGLAERPNDPVLIVEGEKAARAAHGHFKQMVVTTSVGGASNASQANWSGLTGKNVTIWPDADDPGVRYAQDVARLVHASGAQSIAMVNVEAMPPHWDLADEVPDSIDIHAMLADAMPWQPEAAANAGSPEPCVDWSMPKPLPEGLRPVAPFDLQFLPESIRPWIGDISDRMQCPPDFVGVPAMIALGSVLGRKVGVRPQRKTDWIEVPNLWGFIVGRPGAMKSPAMAEALKPLNRLEAEARKANEAAAKEFEVTSEIHKLAKKQARKAATTALENGGDARALLLGDGP